MSLEFWTGILGWASLIHIGLLLLSTVALLRLRGWVMGIHSRLAGVDEAQLPALYMGYLALYKILIITFFLVPYLVLRLGLVG